MRRLGRQCDQFTTAVNSSKALPAEVQPHKRLCQAETRANSGDGQRMMRSGIGPSSGPRQSESQAFVAHHYHTAEAYGEY